MAIILCYVGMSMKFGRDREMERRKGREGKVEREK